MRTIRRLLGLAAAAVAATAALAILWSEYRSSPTAGKTLLVVGWTVVLLLVFWRLVLASRKWGRPSETDPEIESLCPSSDKPAGEGREGWP
jgi:hypothetical protein